ncbi:MAG: A24 family peptidase [Peptococcaceae bacterium]|nr:A24 family peptidase [Peptococcaceae bacterium]
MESLFNIKFDYTDYLLIAMMIICITTDIKCRRIYNKVLVPFLVAALGANFYTGGWPHLLDSAKGILLGLAVLIIPFAKGGIGGGDVKLLAAIGGIKGSSFVLSTFLAGALAGGVLALIILVRHRQLLKTLQGFLGYLSSRLNRYGIPLFIARSRAEDEKQLHLPYSLAIGAGVAASYSAGIQALLR